MNWTVLCCTTAFRDGSVAWTPSAHFATWDLLLMVNVSFCVLCCLLLLLLCLLLPPSVSKGSVFFFVFFAASPLTSPTPRWVNLWRWCQTSWPPCRHPPSHISTKADRFYSSCAFADFHKKLSSWGPFLKPCLVKAYCVRGMLKVIPVEWRSNNQ